MIYTKKSDIAIIEHTKTRAGKNLRFFRKKFRFLGFLGFNVRTVARGTLDTGIR